jgi:hypothetical protein
MQKIQNGAVGVIIRTTIREEDDNGDLVIINLASVTQKNIIFKKPSGALVTKAGVFYTDGADGKLQYLTIAGDLDEDGIWSMQADFVFPGAGYDGPTEIGQFRVLPNL